MGCEIVDSYGGSLELSVAAAEFLASYGLIRVCTACCQHHPETTLTYHPVKDFSVEEILATLDDTKES